MVRPCAPWCAAPVCRACCRPGVETVYGDLASGAGLAEALRGADAVIHLAGVTKALRTEDYYTGNVRATEQLAHAMAGQRNPPGPRQFAGRHRAFDRRRAAGAKMPNRTRSRTTESPSWRRSAWCAISRRMP